MFVFQYNGLRDRVLKEGSSYKTNIMQAGLASIVKESKNYIGQNVVVIFDNTQKDSVRMKFPIRDDLVNSTFRYGILKDVTKPSRARDSLVLFEDDIDGKKILAPIHTITLIDMVSVQELSYPVQIENPELSKFFFGFFYYWRGEKGLLHSNPLGAFIDGRSSIIRPGNECKQAYFSILQPMSAKLAFDEGEPEQCSKEYERKFGKDEIASNKTYVIRCGNRKH